MEMQEETIMGVSAPKEKMPFPPWLRLHWPKPGETDTVRNILSELSLHTVCVGAQCPNQGECWSRGTATFMILGNHCTRNCPFCGVLSGVPSPVDPEEPSRIAEAVRRLQLRYCVITSVTRDDLPDGGAAHFVTTVRAIRATSPTTAIEVLTPDFGGNSEAIGYVAAEAPDVFGHNIETVERLHPVLRDLRASYEKSMTVLRTVRQMLSAACWVKSGFMVGCGETQKEVFETLDDLRRAGCDAVTIGQYLKPRTGQVPVVTYVPLEQFKQYEGYARNLGFRFVAAGPRVRSSYRAELLLENRPAFVNNHDVLATPDP